ncbi:Crp/Fnr family transcriptional regulator [Flavipsychrobacter stenotrophus]|uniref:Crp/Fnr family transcriptional regulator n=1 Tax=Flavipsychrobacter stenotrophus TaxID=2077091 RepID=A0A2S7SQR8_9BACT|nr:Crp/Fnr family transcriptional regulator [Flavipsychrobacter stenotrophus]PQJ09094.1 Crp/Fnr family transcriptional regulator [Flavipsychrobacter stenotrophus]
MNQFRAFIQNYTSLPDSEWAAILSCMEERVVKKNEILLHEGKVCRYLYFVESGLLRFFINKDGSDITKFFTLAPYCFTSQVSFTTEQAAKENIQAIEPSVIWQITLAQANALLELRSWNTFIRKLIQEVQQYTEEILQEIQTETAELRYERMLVTHSPLLQRVPLKYLASYLGIAPQSLSRIRKKLVAPSKLT